MNRLTQAGIIAAATVLPLVAGKASAVKKWNFTLGGGVGQGTFTTADVTPTTGTTYTITGISGTYNGASISGLAGLGGATNHFQWDGTQSSPVITDFSGISFSTTTNVFAYYHTGGGFGSVNQCTRSNVSSDCAGDSTVSTLSPVPGPLPILGASAAFGWSRRLRRRVSLQRPNREA